jgi:hypothetical protein
VQAFLDIDSVAEFISETTTFSMPVLESIPVPPQTGQGTLNKAVATSSSTIPKNASTFFWIFNFDLPKENVIDHLEGISYLNILLCMLYKGLMTPSLKRSPNAIGAPLVCLVKRP